MKLYYKTGVCSMASHIILNETNQNYELDLVDLVAKTTQNGDDYRKVNKMGYVPALELDSGVVITEGPAILQYLGDQKPELNLVGPLGSVERAKVIGYLNFVGSELHKAHGPFFKGGSDSEKAAARERLDVLYSYVEGELSAHGPYLTGETFTIADAYLFVVSNWSAHIDYDLSIYPHLKAFQDKVGARPAVQKTLKSEGLI
ncbi:glutathione transferase GstA [Woodsholea maritima]|uniref:glutathione transferase GstA n=1 Tax=Woodsholea maritima TaxID=240237 RepID=UPI000362CB02|nr:glutathione transferase GstA [Woodsholea maritima]